jgi:hypothetical protein
LAPEPLPVTSLYAFRTPFVHAKRQVLPQHCQMLMFQKPCGQVGPKELDSSTETMPPAKPGAPVANVASRDLGSQQNRAIGSNDERNYRVGQALVKRLEKKFGKPKALSILAAKLARAVYFILKRKEPFNREQFFASS